MYDIKGLRAVALYRVSTERQTSGEDKDIPAQKEIVRDFAQREEVILIREFIEGGVSGFKTKMADREELVTIKEMAVRKEFDILIVYKSDRIGRTSDESPMIINFLNKHGIRVFTARDGEIKTSSQMDKLMTMLTFWQNETESVKISERSTDYQTLLIKNGKYRGGGEKFLAYGYCLVNKGSKNTKGRNILDIEINKEESKIVEKIYELSIVNNMGARAIASYLNENGYKEKSKNKNGWTFRAIQTILNNEIYKGYLRFNNSHTKERILSPKLDHLIIIDEIIWDKNQQIIKNRSTKGNTENRGMTNSNVKLSGLVFCGYCGSKLQTWANHKSYHTKKEGKKKIIVYRYRCNNHLVKGLEICKGQSTYGTKKIDGFVEKETIKFMKELSSKEFSKDFINNMEDQIKELEKQKIESEKILEQKQKQKITLKKEIPLAIMGESKFSVEILNDSMNLVQEDIDKLLNKLNEIDKLIKSNKIFLDEHRKVIDEKNTWVEKYKQADFYTQKTMIAQVLYKLYVFKDKITFEYRLPYKNLKDFGVLDVSVRSTNVSPHTTHVIITRTVEFPVAL